MKTFLKIFFIACFVTTGLTCVADSFLPPPAIQGPDPVQGGTTNTYSFSASAVIAPMWGVSASGTINSTWLSGSTYYASVTWTSSGTVTFYDEVGGGVNVSKTITVFTAPNVTPGVTCGTGTVTMSATPGSGGDKVRWYSVASGGTYLWEGPSFTTPSLSSTTTYYAQTWSTTFSQGSSPRTAVVATVGPALAKPSAAVDGSNCGAGVITLSATSASPGNAINWYSSPVGGALVATGTTFTTPSLSATTVYYAASLHTSTGCVSSERREVNATVNKKPASSWAYQLNLVFGSGKAKLWTYLYPEENINPHITDVGSLDLDTANIETKWYGIEANALAGTSSIGRGYLFTTPAITQNTTYYIRMRHKITNCFSDVKSITATVTPIVTNAKIQSDAIRVAGKKTEASLGSLGASEKTTAITYLDGIGRNRQQITLTGSPAGKDIVMPFSYDSLGRSSVNYLPYVANTTNGSFHSGFVAEQANFYQGSGDKIANDNAAFSVSLFEDTPEGRLIEQGGVGQAWQPGSSHTSRIKYGFNTGAIADEGEEVRKFNSNGSSSGFYAAKTLHRQEYTNAQGNKEIIFTNPAGQVIAKKTQLNKTTEGVMVNYIQTYYCYDDAGRVRNIIQPKGVVALKAASWAVTQTLRDRHMFQYVYDDKGQVIEKKVPGAGWEYIVYDQFGRPVLTQDANLRITNQWNFIKYDSKGRVVMTGLYTDTATRASLQASLDGKNYNGSDKYFEIRQSGTFGYSDQAFPTGATALTYNYYDDQDFNYDGTPDQLYTVQGLSGEGTPVPSFNLTTGSKVKIVGTNDWLTSYFFHDTYGRVIQVRSNNHMRATIDNLTTNVYDFEKLTLSKVYHNSGGTNLTIVKRPVYDNMGRLIKIYQALNGGSEQLVAQYEYNELGQMVDKKLHGTGAAGSEVFIQSVDYRYTIRGQLQSINNAKLNTGADNDESNDYFGMELLYDDATDTNLGNTARFDGNISAIKWKAPGGDVGTTDQRSFQFAYDKSNKLESATSKVRGVSAWDKENNAQNENMTYDVNGNLKTLQRSQRKHQLSGTVASYTNETIDNLTYSYSSADVNNLQKVTDAALVKGFDNGTSGTGNDYTYDAAGNILTDNNKGITSITYNHVGKPTRIAFADGKRTTYVYDAGGNKLSVRNFQGSARLNTTHYVGGFVYDSATLSFFGSPEGIVVRNGAAYEYQYSIADHQGNTRVVFSGATPAAAESLATFEGNSGDASSEFSVNSSFVVPFGNANHTPSGSKVVRMNQTYKTGPSKGLKVYPGDKIDIEVWEYHENASGFGTATTGLSTWIANVAGAFGGVSGGTGVDGMIYSGVSAALTGFGCNANQGSSRPAAYLNYILFDKDYKVLDAGWQLAPATTGVKQLLSFPTKTVKEEGYVFAWLSYDNASNQWVYFDDFKVTHTRSNVIQYNEYYPFGLQTSASWTRDNNSNNFLYNAANELNKTTGWYDTFFRGYDPSLGRFMQIDPLAQLYADETPYHYAGNNPVLFNDPLGDKVSGGNMFSRMYDGFHAWQYGRSAEGFASWMDDAGFAGFGGEATGKGYFIGRPVEEIWMVSRYKNEDGSAGDIIDEYFDHYVYEEDQQDDPTIFHWFKNEGEAYKFMVRNSKEKEVMAYVAKNTETGEAGILVLPWKENTRTYSNPKIGLQKNGKLFNDHLGREYRPYEMIHTHPDTLMPSTADESAAGYWEDRYPGFRSFIIQGGMMYQYYPIRVDGLKFLKDYIDGSKSLLPK